MWHAERSIELSMSSHSLSQELAQKLIRIHPIARMALIFYFIGYSAGRLNFELTYSERCYGNNSEWNKYCIEWLDIFEPVSDDDALILSGAISKAHLMEYLTNTGVPFKKTSKRDNLVELAKTVPGLVSKLIKENNPQAAKPKAECKEAVTSWVARYSGLIPVARGLYAMLLSQAIRSK